MCLVCSTQMVAKVLVLDLSLLTISDVSSLTRDGQGWVAVQVLDELSLQESIQRAVCWTAGPDVLRLSPAGTVRFCEDSVPATSRWYATATASYTKLCTAHDATGSHLYSCVCKSLQAKIALLNWTWPWPCPSSAFLLYHLHWSCHSAVYTVFTHLMSFIIGSFTSMWNPF